MLSLFVWAVGMVSSELFLRVRPVALVLVGGTRLCRGWLSSSMFFSNFTAAVSRLSFRVGRGGTLRLPPGETILSALRCTLSKVLSCSLLQPTSSTCPYSSRGLTRVMYTCIRSATLVPCFVRSRRSCGLLDAFVTMESTWSLKVSCLSRIKPRLLADSTQGIGFPPRLSVGGTGTVLLYQIFWECNRLLVRNSLDRLKWTLHL